MSPLDFLVVNDIFLTKTARLAHVVLPAASFAEKEGTFVNADRHVQRMRKVVEPPAGCKTDVDILCELAERMGYDMPARTPRELMDEIAALVPVMAGMSYARLDAESLVWPCLDKTDRGSRCSTEGVSPRPRDVPRHRARGYGEGADDAYPFILTTGRRLQHYNCGSMSRCTDGLSVLCPEERLEIHPQDAALLNVREDQMVEVASRRGKVHVRARLSDLCSPGVVFLSFHFEEIPTNELTGDILDPMACTPDYKVTAVRLTPAGQ